jgi:hypothetical protein
MTIASTKVQKAPTSLLCERYKRRELREVEAERIRELVAKLHVPQKVMCIVIGLNA